jgi:hypothetical protein
MQKVLLLVSLLILVVYGQNQVKDRNLQVLLVPPSAPRLIEVDGLGLTKNNLTKTIDAVQFFFNTLGETTIQFNYYTSSQDVRSNTNPGPQNTASTQFAIAFRAFDVFEYDNNDGVPGFQETTGPNKDVITGLYDLSNANLPWKPIVVAQQVNNGQNVTTFTAQTQDNVFLIQLVFASQTLQVGSAQITPNQVKVDFAIRWFNNSLNVKSQFSTGPSNVTLHPNAQVGLFGVTAAQDSSFSHDHTNSSNVDSLTFRTSNFSAAFQYDNNVTAEVNGIQRQGQVHVHLEGSTNQSAPLDWVSTWTSRITFFSFDAIRPSLVYWDPIVGAASDQTGSTSSPATGSGVTASSGAASDTNAQASSAQSLASSGAQSQASNGTQSTNAQASSSGAQSQASNGSQSTSAQASSAIRPTGAAVSVRSVGLVLAITLAVLMMMV